MSRRLVTGVFILAVLLTAAVVGAATFTVQKWSGNTVLPVDAELADGLVNDAENSYAWAMAEFGDYLYVGTNRNYMRQMFEIMGATGSSLPIDIDSIFPPDGGDKKAKIYRKRLDGAGGWQLFYESPMVTVNMAVIPKDPSTWTSKDVVLDYGYRTMEIKDDALYIITYSFFDSPYSRVLKLPDTTATSADLQEVFRVANQGGSGLRSIATYNDALFIGTEDLKVWRSPSPAVQSAIASPIVMIEVENQGRKIPVTVSDVGGKEGWTMVGDPSTFQGVAYLAAETQGWGGLWDFVPFNGQLYASMADPVNGFSLFKTSGTISSGDLWEWTPLVASKDIYPAAIYPQGMGSNQNAALTMTVFNNRVYGGTFSNWKDMLALVINLASGSTDSLTDDMNTILDNWTPVQVYRFDTADSWELVVGDTSGQASSPYFPTRLSTWGAGFWDNYVAYPDDNYSTNRYVWRMAVHDGMLYMGTMDMRVIIELLAENTSNSVLRTALQLLVNRFNTMNPNNPAGFDLYATSDGTTIEAVTRDGGFGEITSGDGDRYNYGARTLVSGSDGNLYLGTANPFKGCQVWRVSEAVVPPGDDEDDDDDDDDDDSGGGGGGGGGCSGMPLGGFALLMLLPFGALLRAKK